MLHCWCSILNSTVNQCNPRRHSCYQRSIVSRGIEDTTKSGRNRCLWWWIGHKRDGTFPGSGPLIHSTYSNCFSWHPRQTMVRRGEGSLQGEEDRVRVHQIQQPVPSIAWQRVREERSNNRAGCAEIRAAIIAGREKHLGSCRCIAIPVHLLRETIIWS